MAKWFLLAVVFFVLAEWAAFLAVSAVIGLLPAFILLLATSLAGIAVLQYPGRMRIQRLHQAVAKEGLGGLQAGGDAFLTVAAWVSASRAGLYHRRRRAASARTAGPPLDRRTLSALCRHPPGQARGRRS
jgi:hypothetical protein